MTGHGELDPALPMFQSGDAPVLVVTTTEGAQRLPLGGLPPAVRVAPVAGHGPLSARAVLDAVGRAHRTDLALVEAGPRLMGDFFAEQRLDELFLTLAPQVAGRDGAAARPGLVAGNSFAPDHPVWGTLAGVKRTGSLLFLRYAFERE